MIAKLPRPLRPIAGLLQAALAEWRKDDAATLAAALAYHTAFSLAPLLIIIFAVAGLFWKMEAVHGHFLAEVERLIGPEGAKLIGELVSYTSTGGEDLIAVIIGVATLILGATGAFAQLRSALNRIWDVPNESIRSGFGALAWSRVLSFGILLTVGFLPLVSLFLSAVIAALDEYARGMLPSVHYLLVGVNFLFSTGLTTLLFALLYRFLPDATVHWRDVWVGAGMTALLFAIGKLLIGLYLGNSGITSTYGAAGSLAVILVWIYYSAQIFFFGAELTQVYANRYGARIRFRQVQATGRNAEARDEETRGAVAHRA